MTTTVTKTIGTGGDYPDMQSWLDYCVANTPNLTTSDIIWQGKLKKQTFTGSGRLLYINGITTDSTRYVELTTDTGASFRDDAGAATNPLRVDSTKGAYIENTGTSGFSVQCTVPYTRISNLQFKATQNGGCCLQISAANANGDVNNCIIEEMSGSVGVDLTGAGNKMRNSVIINRYTSTAIAALVQCASGASLYNCTLVVPSDHTKATAGISGNYGAPVVENCAIFGVTAVSTGATRTFTNCLTDAGGTLPNGCTLAAYTLSQFTGVTNASMDLRPPSGSALIDAGTTDSTNASIDIVGTSRPAGSAYDVGAWEYQAAGPTLVQYYLGSDFLLGNWTPSTGATLYGCVDEPTTPNDADYIQSGMNPTADMTEMFFSGVQTPATHTNHTLKYRIRGDGSCNMTVGLYCGTVLIHSDTYTPAPASWTTYTIALSTGEGDAIAACLDPTALKLRVTAG